MKKVLLLLFFSFASSSYGVETTVLRESDPEWSEWGMVVHPEAYFKKFGVISPAYSQAYTLLTLGDGFCEHSFSLADFVAPHTPDEAMIYKTSLSCPAPLNGMSTDDKLIFFRLNHMKPMDFADNMFTSIVMIKGLCYCRSEEESCAGLNCGRQEEALAFFRNLARIFEKDAEGSQGLIALHGAHVGKLIGSLTRITTEAKARAQLAEILAQVALEYPELKFEMIFAECPVSRLEDGDYKVFFTDEETPFEGLDEKPETLSFFDGVRISLRPRPARTRQVRAENPR